jgi:hypothetical protein
MKMHNKSWTWKEDALLLSLVKKHHDPNAKRRSWSEIAKHFDRTERSVSQRYFQLNKARLKFESSPTIPKTTKSFLWGLYTVTREG